MRSKSVTNLTEAAADPALDQPFGVHHGGPNPIDVQPIADGVANMNIAEGGRHFGGRAGSLDLNQPLHPPGSPLLRLHRNVEPDVGGPQDEGA